MDPDRRIIDRAVSPLKAIFLRLVRRQIAFAPRRDPVPGALSATITLVGLNLLAIAIALRHWWNWGLAVRNDGTTRLFSSFCLVIAVGAVQYRLWVAGGRFERLLRELADETVQQHRAGSWNIAAYLTVSLIALVVAFALGR
jgi:hypothetical protein